MHDERTLVKWLIYNKLDSLNIIISGGGGIFTDPYPLKIQASPPRDQRQALRSRVSVQEEKV